MLNRSYTSFLENAYFLPSFGWKIKYNPTKGNSINLIGNHPLQQFE
mgnify:CR=1 FL=1